MLGNGLPSREATYPSEPGGRHSVPKGHGELLYRDRDGFPAAKGSIYLWTKLCLALKRSREDEVNRHL